MDTDKQDEGFTSAWTWWSLWLLTLTAGVAWANNGGRTIVTAVEGVLLLGAVWFAFYVQRGRSRQERGRGEVAGGR